MALAARISEKFTVEELKAEMEGRGYRWVDFEPDPEGKRYRNWYFRNRRRVNILVGVFHFDNPNLVFYEEVEPPTHPLQGRGRFKAIYLHHSYYLCPVTLVWAEMVNTWARIEYIDGEPLHGQTHTSTTRLLIFHPYRYHLLRTMSLKHAHYFETWGNVLEESLLSNMWTTAIPNESEEVAPDEP